MRNRLAGLVAGIALTTAVATMAASPAYAATYFVKNTYKTQTVDRGCSGPALDLSGGTFGSVVYTRTGTTMSATVHLHGATANHGYQVHLASTTGTGPGDTCGTGKFKNFTTNGSGDGTVTIGPQNLHALPYSGTGTGYDVHSFWVLISDGCCTDVFSTERVPAHGF